MEQDTGDRSRWLRASLIGTMTVGLALTLGSPAWANSSSTSDSEVTSETTVIDADAAEVLNAREAAVEDRARGEEPADLKDLRNDLAESAAEAGETLLPQDTESFDLSDGVQVAIPADVEVLSVDVVMTDGEAVAEVVAQTTAGSGGVVQGQGMGWTHKASGTFIIRLSGQGEMESRFIKSRFTGDGPDLMSMRRKAMGRAFEIDGKNWSVTGLYISSHVIDEDKQWVNGRYEAKPASDRDGDCDDMPFSLDIKGVGWAFKDCDTIDIAWDASNVGYYRAYMKQGAVFSGGDREVGFHNVIKIDANRAVNYKHYQRLEMARWVYPADTCGSWNTDKTC